MADITNEAQLGRARGFQKPTPPYLQDNIRSSQTFAPKQSVTGSKQMAETYTRPAQISAFAKLPQELQDMILPYVRREDLPNLCGTCQALRKTTLPFLMQEITFIGEGNNVVEQPRQLLLLRTLSESPQLGEKIKTLRFRTTHVLLHSPTDIMAFAPKLATLEYDYHIEQSDCEHDTCLGWGCEAGLVLDAYDLASALDSVKNTLTHLKISYELYIQLWPEPHITGHCSLKPLSKLKTASIPLGVLLGFDPANAPMISDVLPPSLIHLTLAKDVWYCESALWDNGGKQRFDFLVDFVLDRGSTPHLTVLNVITEDVDDTKVVCGDDNAEIVSKGETEFKELCIKNGITCEVFRLFDVESWIL